MWRCRPAKPQEELYRNALADEVLFVHRGRGELLTHFGVLPFKPFDYIVMPRCTTYDLVFAEGEEQPDLLVIESSGTSAFRSAISIPTASSAWAPISRARSPWTDRAIGPRHGCAPIADTTVLIKDGERLTRYTLADNPFDVVGWDGFVYPFTFNADDFEPITGTIHQPPPIHQTFESPGFVVCTFAPRMLDTHPDAIKVPYAHSNVESDEVLVLRSWSIRQPPRSGRRLVHAAPARHSARAASRHHQGQSRSDADRRTGRHGRYVPPALPDEAGDGTGRRELSAFVARLTREMTLTSARPVFLEVDRAG